MIEVKILRFDKEKDKESYFEKYKIEKTYKMKLLDALISINEKYNANISFRSSCRAGQCGSCALIMNGEVVLACKAEIEDRSVIEPLNFPVIKDLIVDKSLIEEKVAKMKLFLESNPDQIREDVKTDNLKVKGCLSPFIIKNEEFINLKKVRSCIECYSCLSACPVIKETDNFSGPYFMRYLSKFDFDPRDIGERTEKSIAEGLYCCTSCGNCEKVCPKEIKSFGDAIEKLRALANNKNLGPLDAHKKVKKLILKTGRSVEYLKEGFIEAFNKNKQNNAVSETKSEYENEIKSKVKNKIKISDERLKIGVFIGCMVDYRFQEVGFALIDVLKKNGVEVEVPEEQVCCGSPLLRTGQIDVVDDLIEKNKKVFSEYDAIITVCAGCGATLKNDYPKYGVNLNVLDISEFLVENLDTSQMKDLNMKVTYHDPCHLVRGQGIAEEPRRILNLIKGLEFVEMEKPAQCCGAGGGVKAGKSEIALILAKKKVDMIKKLDVDALISICPFCKYNIQDALEREGLKDIKVMNILELLQMAYEI